jgi:methylmalonyl-CoA/ethylmalonyl-CoA epimerase
MDTFEFWHDHGAVSVPNLDDAIKWYHDILGFDLERRAFLESVPASVAVLINGPLRIELFQAEAGKPPSEDRAMPDEDIKTWGNKHISFAADNVEKLGAELRRRGADIVWIKKFAFGSNIFMRDNSGNLIEIVQRPRPASAFATL